MKTCAVLLGICWIQLAGVGGVARAVDKTPAKPSQPKKAEGPKFIVGEPTEADVKYGLDECNVLDFWKAKSTRPTPLLLCIHGGGFYRGDKKEYRIAMTGAIINDCLAHGISCASMNYRFVQTSPFPAPFDDGARAVQFLRSKASEWNLDPKRIGVTGVSAGANLGLWLACHDDLADRSSKDPISRQSTRISFVVGYGAQAFNDPALWQKYIYASSLAYTMAMPYYGVTKVEEMRSDRIKKLAYDLSPWNLVTKDDPPLFLAYGAQRPLGVTPMRAMTAPDILVHHPRHGQLMKEKYDALGLECEFHYHDNPEKSGDAMRFVLKHFRLGENHR